MLIKGLILALAFAGTSAAAPAVQAWSQFKGGPQRLGRGPALRLPVQEAWRAHIKGSSYSSPAIAGELVALGSSRHRVYTFNLINGSPQWEQALPGRVWGSSPAVHEGTVYVGSVDGCVHSMDLVHGVRLKSYCAGAGRDNDVLSSPLIADGRLYFGSDDQSIYAWDLGQPAPRWTFATGGILHDNGAALCNGLLLMGSQDHKLYALDAATGALRWSFQGMDKFNTVPVCEDGTVYVGNADGYVYALDVETGKKRWNHALGRGVMSSPALDGAGYLYVGGADRKVYCLDTATGLPRWTFKTGDVVLASPLVTGSLVWVGSYDGKLYALDRERGDERWSMQLRGGVFTSVAVAGDRLIATGRDGDVVCLRATPDPSFHP